MCVCVCVCVCVLKSVYLGSMLSFIKDVAVIYIYIYIYIKMSSRRDLYF